MKTGIIASAIAVALLVSAPIASYATTAAKPAATAVVKKSIDCKATPDAKACLKHVTTTKKVLKKK